MTVDYTKVHSTAEGRGFANNLGAEGVEWARREHLKINPVCSFARAVFERTPSYEDVRAH